MTLWDIGVPPEAVIGNGTQMTQLMILLTVHGLIHWQWKMVTNPKSFFKIHVFNQYNDHNIGFKVCYHGMAIYYVNFNLEYHILI